MRFALITADATHAKSFRINSEEGDGTSFMNWVDVWGGVQFNFERIMEQLDILKHFDVVMMSGHLNHIVRITEIARYLKNSDTVTMFYPEGSVQLYDNSINGFHREYYEAWNACDVLSIAEEDKRPYYESFVTPETLVRFIHVPMRAEMESGAFLVGHGAKGRHLVVYGDNNPNHPLIAFACAARLGVNVVAVEVGAEKVAQIQKMFPNIKILSTTKVGQYPFLRLLGGSIVHIYPTEWFGTARQQISCAVVGTPCIGSRDSHTQQRLYPKWMGVNIYDVDATVELARDLLGGGIYEEIARHAFEEAVRFYGLTPTKKRFFEAVEAARAVKNKAKVAVA